MKYTLKFVQGKQIWHEIYDTKAETFSIIDMPGDVECYDSSVNIADVELEFDGKIFVYSCVKEENPKDRFEAWVKEIITAFERKEKLKAI